ncbi:hypothetical protein, partial [Brevundimonas sp. 357]|uniref:hypothetical protein n=1 Tax=Brevundimonas sp. 357 TaxID=2555782 RepID=UPI001A9F8DC6
SAPSQPGKSQRKTLTSGDPVFGEQISEVDLSRDILNAMQRAGASLVQLDRLASLWTSEWPKVAVGDLHIPPEGEAGIGKGCEVCLADDASAGRDHYLRNEWRLAWRVTCQRHYIALVEFAAAELMPVMIAGRREYRVRFVRNVDQVADPFRRASKRRGARKGSPSALGLCLETDICSALQGSPFPDCWCVGPSWSAARIVLMDLTDMLLTQARGSRERLIHRFADGDWVPQEQAANFRKGSFPLIGAFWQRRLLESCARLLIDPSRFEHLEGGYRLNVHSELAYGRIGQQRARSALGQLATSDLFSLLFAYVEERHLTEMEQRIRRWPSPLINRVAAAAAVALYIQ